jgi:hypothetical protein
VNGVAFTDVQSLAGATLLASSGKVVLGLAAPLPANANLLGLMSQSLGTFAVGQGMPGYFESESRFVDNGDGTVTDRQTGLQWEKKTGTVALTGPNFADPHWAANIYSLSASGPPYPPDGTAYTDFLVRLNGSSSDGVTLMGCFAGHCDWRLPTIVELQTIRGACGPEGVCIDPVFGPTASTFYWSATTANLPGSAWAYGFDFDIGGLRGGCCKDGSGPVRAVRGGS